MSPQARTVAEAANRSCSQNPFSVSHKVEQWSLYWCSRMSLPTPSTCWPGKHKDVDRRFQGPTQELAWKKAPARPASGLQNPPEHLTCKCLFLMMKTGTVQIHCNFWIKRSPLEITSLASTYPHHAKFPGILIWHNFQRSALHTFWYAVNTLAFFSSNLTVISTWDLAGLGYENTGTEWNQTTKKPWRPSLEHTANYL